MEWDPELLAKLRELRESRESTELRDLRELRKEASLRRKQRTASSLSANQATTSQIKMIVSQWYTDELGNRARMIYNAKMANFEAPYDSPRGVSAALHIKPTVQEENKPAALKKNATVVVRSAAKTPAGLALAGVRI